jgi:hypothetical protein
MFRSLFNRQPISEKHLIAGLNLGSQDSRQTYANGVSALLYAFGANDDVSVSGFEGHVTAPGLSNFSGRNFEAVKTEWQQKGGTIPSFNNAIRAALVKSLGKQNTIFAQSFAEGSQAAAAEAKRAFPNDPGREYDSYMRAMRNGLWVRLNDKGLPPGVTDINQCRVVINGTGDRIVGLVAQNQITPQDVRHLYNPEA